MRLYPCIVGWDEFWATNPNHFGIIQNRKAGSAPVYYGQHRTLPIAIGECDRYRDAYGHRQHTFDLSTDEGKLAALAVQKLGAQCVMYAQPDVAKLLKWLPFEMLAEFH